MGRILLPTSRLSDRCVMKPIFRSVIVALLLLWQAGLASAGNGRVEGIVYPLDDVELSMPVDGLLMTINVKEGEPVKKGQLLLGLDGRLQRLEVSRRKTIWQDTSQITTMEKNIILLKELVETKEDLYERIKTVSQTELKQSRMQLNRMMGEYENLKAGKIREKIEYEIAMETLASYGLKSPIDGRIVEITFSKGEWIRTGETVIRIVNHSVCYLQIDVDIPTAERLNDQAEDIRIHIPMGGKELIKTGQVEFVSSIADKGSGLVNIKIFFDNKEGDVIPGVTAFIDN